MTLIMPEKIAAAVAGSLAGHFMLPLMSLPEGNSACFEVGFPLEDLAAMHYVSLWKPTSYTMYLLHKEFWNHFAY